MRWFKSITRSDGPSTFTSVSLQRQPEVTETPATSVGDTERKSVAILPFRNLSNDAEMNFYEFSQADAVITELARVRQRLDGLTLRALTNHRILTKKLQHTWHRLNLKCLRQVLICWSA